MENTIGVRINAIKPQSQTNHIKLGSRITFNTGSVTNMANNLMIEFFLQVGRSSFKGFYLPAGEWIKTVRIASHQMREDRPGITVDCR